LKAFVLTYHSHHCLGTQYHLNDHLALPVDLASITQAGYRIVSLSSIVDLLLANRGSDAARDPGEATCVALTFDDGPVYDLDDFVHPTLGWQRGFVGAMQDFAATALGAQQPELTATSFVIASPEARRIMETTYDAEYTYLGAGSMGDEWWERAAATGLLAIGNHSWDHLHPALVRVAHSKQVRADFSQVLSVEDADAQVLAASRFIAVRTGGRAVPFFAYPFGHSNEFLTATYFPERGSAAGIRAAFTTEPRGVRSDDSVWRLPRLTCGHHWKTPAALCQILSGGSWKIIDSRPLE
jgi:peptidoglycan/xylan/chitin deacetylase (PgdA/CDA1 family)